MQLISPQEDQYDIYGRRLLPSQPVALPQQEAAPVPPVPLGIGIAGQQQMPSPQPQMPQTIQPINIQSNPLGPAGQQLSQIHPLNQDDPQYKNSKIRTIFNAIAGGLAGAAGGPKVGAEIGAFLHDMKFNRAQAQQDRLLDLLKPQVALEKEQFSQGKDIADIGLRAGMTNAQIVNMQSEVQRRADETKQQADVLSQTKARDAARSDADKERNRVAEERVKSEGTKLEQEKVLAKQRLENTLPFWAAKAADPNDPDHEKAKRVVNLIHPPKELNQTQQDRIAVTNAKRHAFELSGGDWAQFQKDLKEGKYNDDPEIAPYESDVFEYANKQTKLAAPEQQRVDVARNAIDSLRDMKTAVNEAIRTGKVGALGGTKQHILSWIRQEDPLYSSYDTAKQSAGSFVQRVHTRGTYYAIKHFIDALGDISQNPQALLARIDGFEKAMRHVIQDHGQKELDLSTDPNFINDMRKADQMTGKKPTVNAPKKQEDDDFEVISRGR